MDYYSQYQIQNDIFPDRGNNIDINLIKNTNYNYNNKYFQREIPKNINVNQNFYNSRELNNLDGTQFNNMINQNLHILEKTLNKAINKKIKNEYMNNPIQEQKNNIISYQSKMNEINDFNNPHFNRTQNINSNYNNLKYNNYYQNKNYIENTNFNNTILYKNSTNNNFDNKFNRPIQQTLNPYINNPQKNLINKNNANNIHNEKINNYIHNVPIKNTNNYYKYMNNNKRNILEDLGTNRLSNYSSNINLMDTHKNKNEDRKRDFSFEKLKKNNKNEKDILTPNINNYQNNFYVQYTTPRRNDGFNFDPNKNNYYNNNDVNEFENDSINLSFLADKIVQCFDLDKKDSGNVLIEELPIQNDEKKNKENLNRNNIKNVRSFDDSKTNKFLTKNEKNKVNQNMDQSNNNNDIQRNYQNNNKNKQSLKNNIFNEKNNYTNIKIIIVVILKLSIHKIIKFKILKVQKLIIQIIKTMNIILIIKKRQIIIINNIISIIIQKIKIKKIILIIK